MKTTGLRFSDPPTYFNEYPAPFNTSAPTLWKIRHARVFVHDPASINPPFSFYGPAEGILGWYRSPYIPGDRG